MSHWKTAGGIIVGAATVLAAGVALVDLNRHHLEILGWFLIAGGAAIMFGAALWLPLRLILPRLARLLAEQLADRLDLDYMARRVAALVHVPEPEAPSPLFPEQVAATVAQHLREHRFVRTPELESAQQERRKVAHDAIAALDDHIISLTRDTSKLQPFNHGLWGMEKVVLQGSPIYDDAVYATERAFQLISRLQPNTSNVYAERWAEAARYAEAAADAMRAAIKEDV
jgi:hypothetical protein